MENIVKDIVEINAINKANTKFKISLPKSKKVRNQSVGVRLQAPPIRQSTKNMVLNQFGAAQKKLISIQNMSETDHHFRSSNSYQDSEVIK